MGDKATEGRSYGNLGSDYHSLGDFFKSQSTITKFDHRQRSCDILGEGNAYGNLGNSYDSIQN